MGWRPIEVGSDALLGGPCGRRHHLALDECDERTAELSSDALSRLYAVEEGFGLGEEPVRIQTGTGSADGMTNASSVRRQTLATRRRSLVRRPGMVGGSETSRLAVFACDLGSG
jgi:hypothetical protein